jgi:hypothetical protein
MVVTNPEPQPYTAALRPTKTFYNPQTWPGGQAGGGSPPSAKMGLDIVSVSSKIAAAAAIVKVFRIAQTP